MISSCSSHFSVVLPGSPPDCRESLLPSRHKDGAKLCNEKLAVFHHIPRITSYTIRITLMQSNLITILFLFCTYIVAASDTELPIRMDGLSLLADETNYWEMFVKLIQGRVKAYHK